jgi:succinate dehydrogenase flavin-adding protein (antitoxin of CptAB toxin-antitoxin module)
MRYDDRVTSVELNNTNELLALLNEEDTKMENWIANVIETALAVYDPAPEYLDQEWLDKGNY